MEYVYLKRLPEDHHLRNTLLAEIRAEYKHIQGVEFTPVEHGRPMAEYTYNTLEEVPWKRFVEWRAPKVSA